MRILVGISGSIAVVGIHTYLLNLMMEKEVEEVRAVMTPTASRFLNPRSLEVFLQSRVHVDLWSEEGAMVAPPALVEGIDLYLVAPASATTLSRCASGSGETLVANCYLCHSGVTAFAPSMSPEMWKHPAVRRNLESLREFGSCILPPGEGYSIAAKKTQRNSVCSYADMWPKLKALVEKGRP